MPLTFITIGIVLLISAVNGQAGNLFALVKGDFTNTSAAPGITGTFPSFAPWIVSMFAIGALGYIPTLKTVSRALLVLVIVVLFLSKNGFFAKLETSFPGLFSPTQAASGNLANQQAASTIGQTITVI